MGGYGLDPWIYTNQGKDVFIVDIPTSIAAAQNNCNILRPSDLRLKSAPPQEEPFESIEPKTQAAANRVSNHGQDEVLHESYIEIIKQAIAQLRTEYQGKQYCYRRIFVPNGSASSRKRDAAEALEGTSEPKDHMIQAASESDLYAALEELRNDQSSTKSMYISSKALHKHDSIERQGQISGSSQVQFFHNDSEDRVILSVEGAKKELHTLSFHVPPRSALLLGPCEGGPDFRSATRIYGRETRGRFDFVLLDPPWPNRSALRKSSYKTPRDAKALESLLLRMDLDSHILPGGFVAIWVTNKPAYWNLVLGSGGLFEAWNVGLKEEWIWVKITSRGKPVTTIDGKWRKPYEVLLIGQAAENSLEIAEAAEQIKRRVIFGVPDLHSRKPCLQRMVEQVLLQRHPNYTAMEVFARHLVAGWFSCGDEVLKYNWDGYWVASEEDAGVEESGLGA